jgi:hypothetical protein
MALVVALRARISLRGCVSPTSLTVFALTIAPFFGEVSTIRGFVPSRTYVTTGDGSDSPPALTIVAVNALAPSTRITLGTMKRGVRPTGISVSGAGSWSPIAT